MGSGAESKHRPGKRILLVTAEEVFLFLQWHRQIVCMPQNSKGEEVKNKRLSNISTT